MRADAQLADVAFVDAEHGWAVGDRGAIWATDDGGEHWRLQPSGVDCRLSAVAFLDARQGWAAGGGTDPATRASRGAVLTTRDGGQHWSPDAKLLLPAITAIKFFDRAHGWAITRPSPLFSSNLFATDDGGRSWMAAPALDGAAWTSGDFVDPFSGALAGERGALAMVRRRGMERSPFVGESLRDWHRVRACGGGQLWAVGDGAWIFRSDDLGRSWQAPAGSLDGACRDHFDFHAVCARDNRCWIAGSPGTRVFHSADGGRSWTAQATGVSTPIRAITFVDADRGWAVGDLGLILATRDGGRSWRRQRSPATRAALWGCFSAAGHVPVELISRLSADEGYLSVVDILGRRDLDGAEAGGGDAAGADQRIHEAIVAAGGAAGERAWRFPLRQTELRLSRERLIEGFDRANDGRGLERLEAQLVARIRQWRPTLIVTADAPRDAAQRLIQDTLVQAVEHAADPTWFSEQLTLAGLEPWRARRVVAALAPGEPGALNVNTSQLAGRLGHSYAELAAAARGLLADDGAPPAVLGFRPLDETASNEPPRDFFSGAALAPGGEARRMLPEVARQNLESLKRAAQTRRNLDALFARADAAGGGGDARLLGEAGTLAGALEPAAAAAVLHRLADQYHHRGQWQSAADIRELIVEKYPDHPLAAASLEWLAQYYSSGEAQHRARRGQGLVAEKIAAVAPRNVDAAPPNRFGASAVRPAAAREPLAETRERTAAGAAGQRPDGWPARAMACGKRLEQLSPALFAEPRARFPLAAAQRADGYPRQADRYYLGLARARPHDAWWACAAGEAWLADPQAGQAAPPKKIWSCRRAAVRPVLDGKLEDPVWRGAEPIELRSALRDDAEWPAVVMAAYDDEYLYWAASCRGPRDEAAGAAAKTPRPRDADLSARDRVELLIDLDRDWVTYYRLAIDHRGWTRDACWGDASWNPRWFVAHGDADGGWTAEAAIPLAELTTQTPGPRTVWAVGAQRIAPGVGFQSWTQPASIAARAEGFGYLVFE